MARTRKSLPDRIDIAHLIGARVLASLCPRPLIDEVLAQTGRASQRNRLLSAPAVVYYVIALALWQSACATGAKLLWRLRADIRLPVLERYEDGSYRSEGGTPGSRTRKAAVLVVEYTLGDIKRKDFNLNSIGTRNSRSTRRGPAVDQKIALKTQ